MAKKIAIIGGGIIGLYIGWKLSQKEEEVVIFEKRKKEFSDFKCCSGLVSERIRDFIPIEKSMVMNRIDSCKIIFLKKKVELFFKPNHLALDREAVVRKLIVLNEEVGTEIRYGEDVSDIPSGFDKVIVCDGANSFYRRKMNDIVKFKLGAQLIVKKSDKSNHVETYPIKSGFCWKIPRGDSTEYGIMADQRKSGAEFDKFLNEQNIDRDSGEFHSAIIPQPRFGLSSLFFSEDKNIFLCGDSMGLTKPWSGGGIIWGLTAADILIKNIDNSLDYRREVERKFNHYIFKGYVSNMAVRWFGFYFPFFLPSKVVYDNDFPNALKSISGLIKR